MTERAIEGQSGESEHTKDELFALLLTPEEEFEESKRFEGNMVLRFGRPGEEAVIHGTSHEFSLEPIAGMIQTFDEEQPDLLLVEGTAKPDIKPGMSGEEILNRFGEQAYMRWYAEQKGIAVKTWDVPWVDRFRDALRKHETDAVIGWTIAYAAKLLIHKNEGTPTSVDEVKSALQLALDEKTIEILEREHPGIVFDPKKIDIDALIKKFSGGKGVADLDAEMAENLGTPRHHGATNDVIRDMIDLRDRHAIEIIDKARREHKKIFVTAGDSHVLTWEKALKRMFEK